MKKFKSIVLLVLLGIMLIVINTNAEDARVNAINIPGTVFTEYNKFNKNTNKENITQNIKEFWEYILEKELKEKKLNEIIIV